MKFTGTLLLDNYKSDVRSVVIVWLNILMGSHSHQSAISNQNLGTALQMKALLTVLMSNHIQAENWGWGQNIQQQVSEFINKEVEYWKTVLSGTI